MSTIMPPGRRPASAPVSDYKRAEIHIYVCPAPGRNNLRTWRMIHVQRAKWENGQDWSGTLRLCAIIEVERRPYNAPKCVALALIGHFLWGVW